MKNLLRLLLALASVAIATPATYAADTAPAADTPLYTMALPANIKTDDLVNAVKKAFDQRKWTNVVVNADTVTASYSHGGVSVSSKAVCSANEVKFFADSKGEGKYAGEKSKAVALRWIRNIEKDAKVELGLAPKKDKHDKKEKDE